MLRATFHGAGRSTVDQWSPLRATQTPLGGMRGADRVIGHCCFEVAQLGKRDRDEVLLELPQEEVWRLQQ